MLASRRFVFPISKIKDDFVWPYSSLLHKYGSSLLVKILRKVWSGRAYSRSYSVKLWTSSIKVLIVMGWSKSFILSFFSLNLFKYALVLSHFHWIMEKNLVELLDSIFDPIISHLARVWAELFFHLEPLSPKDGTKCFLFHLFSFLMCNLFYNFLKCCIFE
jgi:hypothetical protein